MLLRRLESAFEVVFAEVVVDRSGFESAVEDPVDKELLRLGRGVVAAIICIAAETLPAGLAVDWSVRM